MIEISARRRKVAEIFLTAVWFGLFTGILYMVIDRFTFHILHRLTWTSRDILWMAPLANVLLFLPPAVLLAVAGWFTPNRITFRLVVVCFAFLSVFTLLLPYGQLALYAIGLMALGIAVQAGRSLHDPARWLPRLRRSGMVMAIGVVLLGVGLSGWRALSERRSLRKLASTGAPNVLLIILDTVRAASMSLYGRTRPTSPELVSRASEGVVFDRAVPTASWTLTSHGSMFTGLYPNSLGGGWRTPIRYSGGNLAGIFRNEGYATAGFVANLWFTSYQSGLAAGFTHYEDHPISFHQILLHSSLARAGVWRKLGQSRSLSGAVKAVITPGNWRIGAVGPGYELKRADQVSRDFLHWQQNLGGHPFFAFLNYFDAHDPYRPPAPFRTRFGAPRGNIDLYEGTIAYMDQQVGKLLDELGRRHLLDSTIVVIVSDHGEQFGEHHLVHHANSLYLTLLQVPLIIRYPGRVPAGRRVEEVVSLRDLPATILDLAGVENRGRLPGRSLVGLWGSPAVSGSPAISQLPKTDSARTNLPNARGPMRSIVDDSFHYIIDGDRREALYAYRHDSLEVTDLAGTQEGRRQMERLRSLLVRTLSGTSAAARDPKVSRGPAPSISGTRPPR